MRGHSLVLALLFVFVPGVIAQGDFSVLFNGVVPLDNISVPGDNFGISEMSNSDFNPGVEVRFRDSKRFSFGVGYNRFGSLFADTTDKNVVLLGGEWWSPKELVTTVSQKSSRIDSFVGSVYYNCRKKGSLRPFVGAGLGVNSVKEIQRVIPHTELGWEYMVDVFNLKSEEVMRRSHPSYKAVVGVNYYPHKNFVLSISAGYFNGPAMMPGVGVTF